MPNRKFLPLVAAFTLLSLPAELLRAQAPAVAIAQPAEAGQKFLRFVDDGRGGGRLESAIVSYRNEAGQTVRLVAAVHIGEKDYYQGLNATFAKDDAVLYELVKPKGAAAPEPGFKSGSGVSQLQRFMKDTLNLEFQLDQIDYTRPNFVHADLDAETFTRMQEERGESMFTLMLKEMINQYTHPSPAADVSTEELANDLIKIICRPDSERQLKVMLARHMNDIESMASGLDGKDGSVILTERNKAALNVLRETLNDASKKKISIFYGAAHMASMAQSLKDMGFKQVSADWKTAWDLAIRADQPSAIEKLLRQGMKALDD